MSDGFEQAFTIALDDLNNDQLGAPEDYLTMVPRARHNEFVDRLTAAIGERGPVSGDDLLATQGYRRALAAVAQVRASSGSSGVLPGALVALRRARGIDRDDVLDHVAAEFGISQTARPALRRFYHRLETGGLLGSNVSHRLLRTIAACLGADGDDFIASIQPIGRPRRLTGTPAIGRPAGGGRPVAGARAGPVRPVPPDLDIELVERLFCGGPDA
jgi:hypothetical protein